jgi:hypothetical protein
MKRLIEWDSIEVRISGDRVDALAQSFRVDPIEKLNLRFLNGLLRVEGSVRKFVNVPFSVDIREILPSGTTVRVPLTNVQAFGGLPIPQFLFPLVQSRLPKGLVTFEPPATFVVELAQFIPDFVDADLQKIWIIDGGLSVTLGRGGADPPIPGGPP